MEKCLFDFEVFFDKTWQEVVQTVVISGITVRRGTQDNFSVEDMHESSSYR